MFAVARSRATFGFVPQPPFIGLPLTYATEIPTNLMGRERGRRTRRIVPVCYRNLGDGLHLCSTGKLCARRKGVDL